MSLIISTGTSQGAFALSRQSRRPTIYCVVSRRTVISAACQCIAILETCDARIGQTKTFRLSRLSAFHVRSEREDIGVQSCLNGISEGPELHRNNQPGQFHFLRWMQTPLCGCTRRKDSIGWSTPDRPCPAGIVCVICISSVTQFTLHRSISWPHWWMALQPPGCLCCLINPTSILI